MNCDVARPSQLPTLHKKGRVYKESGGVLKKQ